VGWLKFNGIRMCAPTLAALMSDKLGMIAPPALLRPHALLIPIPLHPRRRRERGFNQSADLADFLSRATGIAVAHLLTRERFTWTQTKLPTRLRAVNTSGAFSVTKQTAAQGLPHKRWFLLVDDVTTTGSTLSAAGFALRPLLPPGAQVWGVTVARG
jgi:ComF family protein